MENITQLREFLSRTINDLQNGDIDATEANTYSQLAGKILTSVGIEIMYNRLQQNEKEIKFMETNNMKVIEKIKGDK